MTTKETGQKGEDLACEYLVKNGYKILGRNYRINFGEIDVIAKKKGLFAGRTIHFVEVKASSQVSGPFSPEQRANYRKQNKVKKLAEIWLTKNKIPEGTPYQIDVMGITIAGDSPKIDFFENVVAELIF